MAEGEKHRSLVEGTPEEHAAAIDKGLRLGGQQRANREWVFMGLILLGVAGYAVYAFVAPWLNRAP